MQNTTDEVRPSDLLPCFSGEGTRRLAEYAATWLNLVRSASADKCLPEEEWDQLVERASHEANHDHITSAEVTHVAYALKDDKRFGGARLTLWYQRRWKR